MAFESLFPKAGGGSPAGNAPAPAAAPPGGGLPGGEGGPGTAPPSAQAVIEQFVQYAKSEGIPEEEVVSMIMEAIIAAGYTAPPEEEVAKIVAESYKGAGAPSPTPGGPAGPAPTAPPQGGLPGGGQQVPLQ